MNLEHKEVKISLVQDDLKRLEKLRLLDDDFMTIVFDGNIEATELLLNIFLNHKDMNVVSVVGQREIKNVNGRSIRLDIHAIDSDGKVYDIEVQRADKGAVAQRARFNSSMLDTKLLKAGDNFEKLVDSYVIFITENDVIGKGLPLYHINRRIEETGELFGDGSYILYVNGAYQNNQNQIGKLMHDFRCTKAEDMNFKILAERVYYFKESERGQKHMCKLMEDMRNEAIYAYKIEQAMIMLADGMSYENVAKYSGLTIEEVIELGHRNKK